MPENKTKPEDGSTLKMPQLPELPALPQARDYLPSWATKGIQLPAWKDWRVSAVIPDLIPQQALDWMRRDRVCVLLGS